MQISQTVFHAKANIGTREQSHMRPFAHVKQVKGIKLTSSIKHSTECTNTEEQSTHTHNTDQGARVSGVSRSVVQKAWQAKVRDLADQVAVDQDIPGGEVSVNIVHVWQVLHPCSDATQHPYQLCHGESPIVQLHTQSQRKEESKRAREQKKGWLMNKEERRVKNEKEKSWNVEKQTIEKSGRDKGRISQSLRPHKHDIYHHATRLFLTVTDSWPFQPCCPISWLIRLFTIILNPLRLNIDCTKNKRVLQHWNQNQTTAGISFFILQLTDKVLASTGST